MRIIGGEARGRLIRLPGVCRIRPTADRVKKSLFDILYPIAGKSFLDLFAGSGNVGLEALSRGACCLTIIEKDILLIEGIRMSVDQLGFSDRAEVIHADMEKGLEYLFNRGTRFDLLFADPPYDQDWVRKTLNWLDRNDIMKGNGIVVFQHSVRENPRESHSRVFEIEEQRKYGDTLLSFFRKTNQG